MSLEEIVEGCWVVQGKKGAKHQLFHSFVPHLLNTSYTTATDLGTEYALVNRSTFLPFQACILTSAQDRDLSQAVLYGIIESNINKKPKELELIIVSLRSEKGLLGVVILWSLVNSFNRVVG